MLGVAYFCGYVTLGVMKFIIKAFKWAYGDSLKYIGFMLAFAAIVALLQLFIVYPIQVLTFGLLTTVAIILFTFFSEL
jgi:uncharacterized PurR-regulated membrane protein YhhQ (DUF165 family)